MTPIVVDFPGMKLVSEANRAGHEPWRERQRRAKSQRQEAFIRMRAAGLVALRGEVTITITRIAPRAIRDSDNLAGMGKHVRDGIADALGVNDSDERITWVCVQRKGKPKQHAAQVRVADRETCGACGQVRP